jgi:hypothetical protein
LRHSKSRERFGKVLGKVLGKNVLGKNVLGKDLGKKGKNVLENVLEKSRAGRGHCLNGVSNS